MTTSSDLGVAGTQSSYVKRQRQSTAQQRSFKSVCSPTTYFSCLFLVAWASQISLTWIKLLIFSLKAKIPLWLSSSVNTYLYPTYLNQSHWNHSLSLHLLSVNIPHHKTSLPSNSPVHPLTITLSKSSPSLSLDCETTEVSLCPSWPFASFSNPFIALCRLLFYKFKWN